jgi:hypothetical protein
MTGAEAEPRRRLAFLVRDLQGSGVQRSQTRLAAATAARGHPVDLVACASRLIGGSAIPGKVHLIHLRPTAKLFARRCRSLRTARGCPSWHRRC